MITYKVSIDESLGASDVFVIKTDSSDFNSLKRGILNRMPELKQRSLKFYYKDADGDKVTITNDSDLMYFHEQKFNKIFVTSNPSAAGKFEEPEVEVDTPNEPPKTQDSPQKKAGSRPTGFLGFLESVLEDITVDKKASRAAKGSGDKDSNVSTGNLAPPKPESKPSKNPVEKSGELAEEVEPSKSQDSSQKKAGSRPAGFLGLLQTFLEDSNVDKKATSAAKGSTDQDSNVVSGSSMPPEPENKPTPNKDSPLLFDLFHAYKIIAEKAAKAHKEKMDGYKKYAEAAEEKSSGKNSGPSSPSSGSWTLVDEKDVKGSPSGEAQQPSAYSDVRKALE